MSEATDAAPTRVRLTGWGRTAPSVAYVQHMHDPGAVAPALLAAPARGAIARGLGRAYGDAAQNGGGLVLDCTGLDGIGEIAADGSVSLAGGVSLDALTHAALPQGWFIPVSPGTRHVTVGGAIAADVHGKNHHSAGSFAQHVTEITLALPSGEVHTVTPSDGGDLFWATAGGMGLTGVILRATVRLIAVESRSLLVDTRRTPDFETAMAALAEADQTHPYSVAWIDLGSTGAQGRGIVTRGRHAPVDVLPPGERERALEYEPRSLPAPPALPSGVINRATMRAFNEAWYRKKPERRFGEVQTIDQFFYPLDAVNQWNRLYGANGFLQYQFVVPFGAEEALREVAFALSEAPAPASLVVLKRFGAASPGPLSFPLPGWTLAVDMPATRGADLDVALDQCDRYVAAAGGRVYLAKDSRMRPERVPEMYPRLDEWRSVVHTVDPSGLLTSDLDRRLNLTGRRAERGQS